MFTNGQAVKVTGTKEEIEFFMLSEDKPYHIKEFNTPEECKERWPDRPWFVENGGRIVVEEMPKLEWFGRRFVAVSQS